MKKRILIFSHALELGGAERSLIGLLDSIDANAYDVDLFLMRHEGEMMGMISPNVNLLPEVPAYRVLARPMAVTLKERHLLLTSARLMGKVAAIRYDKRHGYQESAVGLEYSHKYTCCLMPPIQQNTQYDLAISFLTPHYFVANKVRALQKIAWIHTDYSQIHVNVESERKMWSAYDHIASISPAVTESFVKSFPSLRDKVISIENILPAKLLIRQAQEPPIGMDADGIKLVSVGRYCTAKNFDNVPDICARLVAQGLNVFWYLIGFGPDEALIRRKIEEANMSSRVILLGKKENPYPYIKGCDLYVQPSRYEGKSVAVREAQMLGKPVAITAYATSSSQLENGADGVIVPMDNAGCALKIADLLRNPEKLAQLSSICTERDYTNSAEVEKLYAWMENG